MVFVGFGCMSFGGFYDRTSANETMRALELGVDLWDTANVYGEDPPAGFAAGERCSDPQWGGAQKH